MQFSITTLRVSGKSHRSAPSCVSYDVGPRKTQFRKVTFDVRTETIPRKSRPTYVAPALVMVRFPVTTVNEVPAGTPVVGRRPDLRADARDVAGGGVVEAGEGEPPAALREEAERRHAGHDVIMPQPRAFLNCPVLEPPRNGG